jgi:hypothetical protein
MTIIRNKRIPLRDLRNCTQNNSSARRKRSGVNSNRIEVYMTDWKIPEFTFVDLRSVYTIDLQKITNPLRKDVDPNPEIEVLI